MSSRPSFLQQAVRLIFLKTFNILVASVLTCVSWEEAKMFVWS